MNQLHEIHAVIAKARRRLRIQEALEWGTIAVVPAISVSLAVFWLWRMKLLAGDAALAIEGGLGFAVLLVALIGSLRRFPTHVVATRLDRASGLSDRLSTAVEFERRLREHPDREHPDTAALMQRAVADGLRAVPRANVKTAAPYAAPSAFPAACAVLAIGMGILLLSFQPQLQLDPKRLALRDRTGQDAFAALEDAKGLDLDDLEMPREFLADMKAMAEQTGDRHLTEFAAELEKLLQMAEKGELSKEEMMAKMEALEKSYMEGADQDLDAMLEELKEMAKELKKEQQTKELGEALEAGDMESASKELEKLAEKMEKGEMSPEQQKKLADALEKAADKAEKKQKEQEKKDDAQANKDQKKKEDEIRKLKKKLEKEPNNEQAKRELKKKERELEELKRDQEKKKEQARKRSLDRLTRNMKKSAEHLKNKKNQQAAENMKNGAQDSKGIEDEIRKITNQKKVQSQLGDLKEAIRRAKPNKGNGKGKGNGTRIADYKRRAGGGRGNAEAWRKNNGKQGMGQKGQGQDDPNGQPGNGIGDSSDPNLMGDPTSIGGRKLNDDLEGVHGRGPSRRETIVTAAKKGFATAAYKNVYTDYKKLVEEVIRSEKVPQGYKYYVKRYFQRIKPHTMD